MASPTTRRSTGLSCGVERSTTTEGTPRASSAATTAGTFDHLRRSFADGFRLLAVRLQAQGLGRHLRRRGANVPVEDSPFFRLTRTST